MTITELSYIEHGLSQKISAITHTQKSMYSRYEIAEEIGYKTESLAIPHQTHSTNVLFVNSAGEFENCDGLITANPNIVLSLQTADCIPIFLYDKSTAARGLVHAGWRGVVGGIVSNAIDLMVSKGSIVENIHVFLGPSICMNCYEVGAEVADQFENKNKKKLGGGKWFVNLHGQVECQLLDLGVLASKIKSSPICSFENDNCCSYRRDGIHFWG